jgi:hypothetical protein
VNQRKVGGTRMILLSKQFTELIASKNLNQTI